MKTSKALVLLEDPQNCAVLCDHLRRQGLKLYDDPARENIAYDLCFVDAPALAHYHAQVLQLKQYAEPLHLPCVLIHQGLSGIEAFQQYDISIDHVLATPYSKRELQFHLDAALRNRRRSISLHRQISEAEKKAKTLQEHHYLISQLSSDYAYSLSSTVSGELVLEWTSQRYENETGYTLEEVNRLGWPSLIHPEDRACIQARNQRLLAGLPDLREFRIVTKSGETRWVLDQALSVLANDKILRVYGVARDITEQRVMQKTMQEIAQENDNIAQLATVVAFRTDIHGNLTYIGQRWSHISGLPLEYAYTAGWKNSVHPDDLDSLDHWRTCLKQHLPFGGKLRFLKPDGATVWVHVSAEPERINDGSPVGHIGTISDITWQKHSESALRQGEYRLQRALSTLPLGVFILDAGGKLVHYNEAGEKIFGGLPYLEVAQFGEYKARRLNTGRRIEATDWPVVRALRNGETSIGEEIEIEGFDGVRRIVQNSALPIYDSQQNIIGAVTAVQDITERKEAEKELRTHAEILANMAEGVIVTDEHGVIFFANAAMERIYGYLPGELNGKHASVLRAAPTDEARQLIAKNIAILAEHGYWQGEVEARRKNGDIFISASRVSCVKNIEKNYIISVQQDITELKKSERRNSFFAAIVQSTNNAIIACSLDGTVVSWNSAAEEIYGYTSEEMCGQSISILIPAESKGEFGKILSHVVQGQGFENLETRRLRKDGSIIQVSLTVSPIRDANGNIIGTATIARDITEKKRADENLRLWGRAIEASSNGIMIVDVTRPEQPIVYANAAFEHITGYTADEIKGRNARFLQGSDRHQEGMQEIRAALRERREGRATLRNYRKDGQIFWNELAIAPVPEPDGQVTHFIGILNDITKSKRYEAELEYQATHDVLTGLPNRALLEDRLQQALARAHRDKKMTAVLFIDLDRFKIVNDSVGHEIGDKLLRQISARMVEVFRSSDTVARHGGDEFVVVVEQIDHDQEAMDLARRLIEVMAAPFMIANAQFHVNCSIGIGLYPKDGTTGAELLKNADAAMYRAKELGGGHFQFYAPTMNERARERLDIENALRLALDRSEFILHYQPQVDLQTGAVVGVEALLRWQHPELGMVQPVQFIEIAEETGLIVEIGAWVLRTACAQANAWQQAGLGSLRIAVNLSARQFGQRNLVDSILQTLDETGLAAELLDIELTESLVMTDVEHAISVLKDLRSLGVQISLDDFGTGYSSLSYLKKFPIDVLKIDRSFVKEIALQPNDAAIAGAIISMAHGLGIRVIAEGVETEGQCEFLSRSMCDEIQGFLFSRPLPGDEMEALLKLERRLPEHLLRMHKPTRRLLLVDDEPNILSALKRLMRRDGYQILTAASGQEGLDLLAQHDIDVIISDQRMPGMTGVDFLRTVKNLYPDTVRIVLSGFTELQSVTDAVNEGAIYKFLTKPWDDKGLREHIAEAFHHKEMANENRRLDMEVRAANQELAKANKKLENLLRQKQQQIKRSKVSLDIVREALQHVPQPVIGLDEDDVIAYANVAAQDLFSDMGSLLGGDATLLMADILRLAKAAEKGEAHAIRIKDAWYDVSSRSMGKGTQSRGQLITLTQCDSTSIDAQPGKETRQ